MLPILAMLVAGYLSSGQSGQAQGQSDGLGSILGSILGGGQAGGSSAGGLGAMLDFDGNGNPLDDILGMAGKLMR